MSASKCPSKDNSFFLKRKRPIGTIVNPSLFRILLAEPKKVVNLYFLTTQATYEKT